MRGPLRVQSLVGLHGSLDNAPATRAGHAPKPKAQQFSQAFGAERASSGPDPHSGLETLAMGQMRASTPHPPSLVFLVLSGSGVGWGKTKSMRLT